MGAQDISPDNINARIPLASHPWQALAVRLGLTSLASFAAETCTFPLDMVKTRLQIQGEQQQQSSASGPKSAARPSALKTVSQILRQEGPAGLYAGLSPALVRHVFYTGTRITIYEQLRQKLQENNFQIGMGTKLLLGLTAGATGQVVAVPADLVKVRMQADGHMVASGRQVSRRYKGVLHAVQVVVSQQGVRGMWRGTGPAVQRAALVNLGELATYDSAKQAVLELGLPDNAMAHTAASVCSGFVASLVSTPADVVKTRMMNQDPLQPMYRSSLHCLAQTVQREGLAALYTGFFLTWARLGPWQLVFWVTYERLRAAAALGSF